MPTIPLLGRRRDRAAERKAIEERAMVKATESVLAAMAGDEYLRKGFGQPTVGSGSWAGGAWSTSANSAATRLLGRVTGNLASSFGRAPEELEQALQQQGLSWGPPFAPGRPLDPAYGYRRPPRTWNYQTGENVQVTPRAGRISFKTIKALWDAYDIAQICTRHLINDVRTLDYHFEAAIGVRDDVSEDIIKARQFFDSPDKRLPFRAWLAKLLMDTIRYDAGALYIRRNMRGDPIALEVVNGSTLIPLVDYYGRTPTDENDEDPDLTAAGTFHGTITPAYQQVIEGMPWDWLASDDIIYQPLNPQPDSQYGQCPLEAVLLTANTDLRFQWHFLQYFTEGSIPQGFMEAPPDLSDPAQITEWQDTWDALMIGDQAKLRQIRWVPSGANYKPVGPATEKFDSEFPLYLMRRTCAAHGITPADLGFTETVNKATSETQVDVQFRVGTMPVVRHVEDMINLFMVEHLKLRVRLRFDTGREIEDRLSTAQAEGIQIDHGVISPDEPRARLGYPVSMTRPTPRYINNARSGPVPLNALETLAGKIDPETFGPAHDAPLLDHPFVPVPGVMPPIGSQDAKDADNSTAAMQANMVAQGTGHKPPHPDDNSTSPPPRKPGVGDDPHTATVKAALELVDGLLERLDKEGMSGASGVTSGVTGSSGMTGSDLREDDDDEDDEAAEKSARVAMQLRQWRANTLNRFRKGWGPKRFVSADLPAGISDPIWTALSTATNVLDIERAFKDAADPKAPARSEPGARKGQPVAAGIAVVAEDSGRVLMIQRDNDDPGKQAAGRWEWPGGRIDGDESTWDCAVREWQEETGNTLPKGRKAGTWKQDDYCGFVYVIPSESAIQLNPDNEAMDVKDPNHPRAKQTEVMAWWKVKDAKHSDHALRDEFDDFDWDLLDIGSD